MIQTIIGVGIAKYNRDYYIILEDDKLVFDNSSAEYGIIKIPLDKVRLCILEHDLKLATKDYEK